MLIEVTGTVRPVQRATIAAKVMGAIAELPVVLGQRVHAGDLLVKISAGEISARVVQAQSQLNQVERDLDRERKLLTKGASTPDMVKSLEDRLAMTQAMVREAEVMLGYTSVRAPFDGVVARKLASAGDLAAPGEPLLEIEGLGDFQVEAGIPDSLAPRLAPGAALAVEVPAAGVAFTGTAGRGFLGRRSPDAHGDRQAFRARRHRRGLGPVCPRAGAGRTGPGAAGARRPPSPLLGEMERVFVVAGPAGQPAPCSGWSRPAPSGVRRPAERGDSFRTRRRRPDRDRPARRPAGRPAAGG